MASKVCDVSTTLFGALLAIAALLATPSLNATDDWREVAAGNHVRVGAQLPLDAGTVGEIANTGFIVGEDSVAVIDPGGSVLAAEELRRKIEEMTDRPVSHLILTHFHPDHVFGAAAFADVDTVVAHARHDTAKLQRALFYGDRFAAALGDEGIGGLASPNAVVASGETLSVDLGGRIITIRGHQTGHTDNDISVFDEDTKTLWASDLLFAGRLPSLDGSVTGWLDVMDELNSLEPDVVVPGHGPPGSLTDIAEHQRGYLQRLVTSTRSALDENISINDVILEAERVEPGDWLLFADQHPTNVTKAWTELEWD